MHNYFAHKHTIQQQLFRRIYGLGTVQVSSFKRRPNWVWKPSFIRGSQQNGFMYPISSVFFIQYLNNHTYKCYWHSCYTPFKEPVYFVGFGSLWHIFKPHLSRNVSYFCKKYNKMAWLMKNFEYSRHSTKF